MSEFWLLEITSLENSIVMVDTRLDGDIAYKKGISDTIGELKTRMKKATETEQDDLANEIEILRTLSFEMGQQGEQIKSRHTYFLSQPTLEALEKQVNIVLGTLNSDGYDGTVLLGEQKEEWQSMFLPLSEQRKLRNRREGMDIQAEALGLGFSHNQTF